MKVISARGYYVTKSDLKPHEIAAIKTELTVSPFTAVDFQQKPAYFKLFQESETKLYMPKYYGLKKFGTPDAIKLHDGEDIDITFDGKLRQEQEEPVKKMLDACKNPRMMGGILNVFCGGGKTTMALYIACQLAKKTMIIVHKDFLLNQWKERIEQFVPRARIGLIKGKVVDVDDKDIVLASLQSLSMKDYEDDVFDTFGCVIIDEVHHTSAEVFSQALKKVNFKYSIGLSATVKRKDGLSKVFMWYLGDIVYKSTKRKDTVRVIVKEYYDPDPTYSKEHTIFNDKPNMSKMINNICAYQPRNEIITKLLKDILEKEPERKVIILSDRRNHLDALNASFATKGIDSGLYYGGLKQEVLQETEKKQVILATFAIASEGYDQKGLDTLILASPKSDIVQSVGRILRDKEHERKHVPLIVDVIDMFSIFEKQGGKRIKYYQSCGYELDHEARTQKTVPIELNGTCYL